MEAERQSLSVFLILRIFAASFVALVGLAMLFKSGPDAGMVIGAVLAAIGLTFWCCYGYTADGKQVHSANCQRPIASSGLLKAES